jgi:hypothetical protein
MRKLDGKIALVTGASKGIGAGDFGIMKWPTLAV